MKLNLSLLIVLSLAFTHICLGVVIPLSYHTKESNAIKVPTLSKDENGSPIITKKVIPLQGNIHTYGEYFLNITLGTPPQTLRVQVDTGSTDLVVYSSSCKGCPSMANISTFDCTSSKSCVPIPCKAPNFQCKKKSCYNIGENEYCPLNEQFAGGGFLEGYAVQDDFTIGNFQASSIPFGLIESESGPFEGPGIDGVMGLAFDRLSSWGGYSAVSYVIEQYKLKRMFSMCLRQTNPIFEIGADYSNNPQFEWADITAPIWFSVHIEGLQVNNVSLSNKIFLNLNGVIVDSGTTFFIITRKSVWDDFTSTLQNMCSTTHLVGVCNVTNNEPIWDGYCWEMTPTDAALFPPVSIPLKGMTNPITMQGKDYIFQLRDTPYYCMGIAFLENDDIPFIIGDIFLQNYNVVFENGASKIGFGPLSTCPSA